MIGPSLEDLLPSKKKATADEDSAPSRLQAKMKEIDIKNKETETEAKAVSQGLPYINLVGFPIGSDAISVIDRKKSEAEKVICFFNNGQEARLGAVKYNDAVKNIEREIKKNLRVHTSVYLISENSLRAALKLYDTLPKLKKTRRGVSITENDLKKYEKEINNFKDLNKKIQEASLTELVTLIIAAAIKSRASDIHIEAEEKNIKVRYRIDGVLNDVAEMKKEAWPKVISRIKQLAKLKININNKPQDGRFSIYMKDDRTDVRVSALPTAFGESVVMRLLMSSATKLSFEDLGLSEKSFKILIRETERPNGMIITTGPTGSGKTTTLYAILTKLNQPKTKIITLEDPIEYELKGVNQSQVNKDYTFAKGLRSVVRQDPDIIMVGEIRDLETAEIAIQAALTGHLVLSTLHTNSAFGAIPRFLSLGTKPFLLAPALNVVIGQRLVRKICQECKTDAEINTETLARIKKIIDGMPDEDKENIKTDNLKFYQGGGCDACQGLGYKGRIGIYEIMPIEGELEKKITKGKNLSEDEIADIARKNGIVTMVQDGILKALNGITSVDEVFRVSE